MISNFKFQISNFYFNIQHLARITLILKLVCVLMCALWCKFRSKFARRRAEHGRNVGGKIESD